MHVLRLLILNSFTGEMYTFLNENNVNKVHMIDEFVSAIVSLCSYM